ncbi:MAG: DUF4214 domain-containing protein [Rhodocyclaceae bacterium]|nr:DUF4214 domain-containing protein [Rhodocyclaceae bacterium]
MATSETLNKVQQLYVAYYGRPADPGGLQYWAAIVEQNAGNVASIISAFSNTPEATALYSTSVTPAERIVVLYQNILGRDPEPDGLTYWQKQVADGLISLNNLTIAILQGAQNEDATVVSNKLAVANAFTDLVTSSGLTYDGDAATAVARTLLNQVGSSEESLSAAQDKLQAAVNTASVASTNPEAFADIIQDGIVTTPDVIREDLTADNVADVIKETTAQPTEPTTPPSTGGSGGSGGGTPAPTPTFTVTETEVGGHEVITFGGTATGDIVMSVNTTQAGPNTGYGLVTFTRGGTAATASDTVYYEDISNGNKISLAAGQVLSVPAEFVSWLYDSEYDFPENPSNLTLHTLAVDGAGTVKITGLEGPADDEHLVDLSGITTNTLTAIADLGGEDKEFKLASGSKLGKAVVTVTASAENGGFDVGDADLGTATFHVTGFGEISGSNLSGRMITGDGKVDIELEVGGDTDFDTSNFASSLKVVVDVEGNGTVDISGKTGYGQVDVYEIESGATLRLTAAQASGREVEGWGNISIQGTAGADTITLPSPVPGNFGGKIFVTGGAGDDIITGSSGADVFVFESDAASNGNDTINGFTVADDMLSFTPFTSITGGLKGAGENAGANAFEYLTAGASSGGTDIAGKVFLFKSSDAVAELGSLIASSASDGKLGLGSGDKAIALVSSEDNLSTGAQTFSIYYITGSGSDGETIALVGTVTVDAGNALHATNFGIA